MHTACENATFYTDFQLEVELSSIPSTQAVAGKTIRNVPQVKVTYLGMDWSCLAFAIILDGLQAPALLNGGLAVVTEADIDTLVFKDLRFSEDTLPGSYRLQFLIPGGASPEAESPTIEVTTVASRVVMTKPPPANVLVSSSAFEVVATAILADGTAVPNTVITCSLDMSRLTRTTYLAAQTLSNTTLPYAGCISGAGTCGQLDPNTARATTDSTGQASSCALAIPWPVPTGSALGTAHVLKVLPSRESDAAQSRLPKAQVGEAIAGGYS